MLAEQTTAPPLDQLQVVADRADLVAAIEAARAVFVEESVGEYVVTLVRHTRDELATRARSEPAAGIALLRMAKARAPHTAGTTGSRGRPGGRDGRPLPSRDRRPEAPQQG